MEPGRFDSWRALIGAGLVFGSVSWFAWAGDSVNARHRSDRWAAQCLSLLRAGDDMALVDWSRTLEGPGGPAALRLTLAGRDLASWGDPRLLESPGTPDFRFPCQWVSIPEMSGVPPDSRLILVDRLTPGPFVWGGLSVLAFLAGWFASRFGRRTTVSAERPRVDPPSDRGFPGTFEPLLRHLGGDEGLLFLDGNYRVLWASDRAASLLHRGENTLRHAHLLDLGPEEALLDALERKATVEVARPFRGSDAMTAVFEMAPFGLVLRLRD